MRWNMRGAHGDVRGALRLVTAVLLVTLGVGFTQPSAASPGASGVCDDGRDWTDDVLSGGVCSHVNLCSPEQIDLDIGTGLEWGWTFPASCPMDAIHAIGVLVTSEVPFDEGAGVAGGTRPLMSSHGTASPDRVGGGSVPATCGEMMIHFTVVAGEELVATADGRSVASPCPDPGGQNPAQEAFLGMYDQSSGPAGAVARLYWAVFGRLPDTEGFGYWMARTDAGHPLRQIAAAWTGTPEWTEAYADTDNGEFLDRVYANVLGRQPDQGGFDYWLGELDQGLERQELVVLFSGAPEFRERTGTS